MKGFLDRIYDKEYDGLDGVNWDNERWYKAEAYVKGFSFMNDAEQAKVLEQLYDLEMLVSDAIIQHVQDMQIDPDELDDYEREDIIIDTFRKIEIVSDDVFQDSEKDFLKKWKIYCGKFLTRAIEVRKEIEAYAKSVERKE